MVDDSWKLLKLSKILYIIHITRFLKLTVFLLKTATRLMFEWHELTALLKFDN